MFVKSISPSNRITAMTTVASFGIGDSDRPQMTADLLGAKGLSLRELTAAGLPTPPGFTLTTIVGDAFARGERRLSTEVLDEVRHHLHEVERATGKAFGNADRPLLLSVRTGAPDPRPELTDVVLNIGMNDATAAELGAQNQERFAFDCYRRLIRDFGVIVAGMSPAAFQAPLMAVKRTRGIVGDREMTDDDWEEVVRRYKHAYEQAAGERFPQNPFEQLTRVIEAAFRRWASEPSADYRRADGGVPSGGTAVNVQAMVFGNRGEDSATGIAFTRDPLTGDDQLCGKFLVNSQGRDVVEGLREPQDCAPEMARWNPDAWQDLLRAKRLLEECYSDVRDFEFVVEHGKLFALQSETAWLSTEARARLERAD